MSSPSSSLFRSEAAIKALCISVLSRVPMLHHVTEAEIRRTGDGTSGPNWELAFVLPPLSAQQLRQARQAVEPLQSRFLVKAGG